MPHVLEVWEDNFKETESAESIDTLPVSVNRRQTFPGYEWHLYLSSSLIYLNKNVRSGHAYNIYIGVFTYERRSIG